MRRARYSDLHWSRKDHPFSHGALVTRSFHTSCGVLAVYTLGVLVSVILTILGVLVIPIAAFIHGELVSLWRVLPNSRRARYSRAQ